MSLKAYDWSFVAGTEEGSDSKQLQLPQMDKLLQLRATKEKRIEKRRGTVEIADGAVSPTPVGPVRLAKHDDQLIVAGESMFWSLMGSTDTLRTLERAPDMTLTNRISAAHYTNKNVIAVGAAAATDFTVYAWAVSWTEQGESSETYELHIQAVDNVTGAATGGTVVNITEGIGLQELKLVPLGTKVAVIFGVGDAIQYIDVTSSAYGPVSGGPHGTALVASGADSADDQWFDVATHDDGYLLAWFNGTNVVVEHRDASHVQQWTTTTTGWTGTEHRIGVVGDINNGSATWAVGAATDTGGSPPGRFELRGYSGESTLRWTYSATHNPKWHKIALGSHNNGAHVSVLREEGGASQSIRVLFVADGSSGGQSTEAADCALCGKPFSVGTTTFYPVQYYGTQANSAFMLLSHTTPLATGLANPEMRFNGGRARLSLANPASSTHFDGTKFHIMVPALDRFSGAALLAGNTTGTDADGAATGTQTILVVGADAYQMTYRARDRFRHARVGPYTYFGGGTVLQFDGRRLVELGFFAPPTVTVEAQTTGGDLDDGNYVYAFVWEWIDHAGNRHQSAPYVANVTLTGGSGSGSVNILLTRQVPATFKHWRDVGDDGREITLGIYRTIRDGSTFYRLEGDDVETFPLGEPPFGIWVDSYNEDDIELSSRELLYATTGGSNELDNVPPPPARFIVAHEARVIGINDNDPTQLWYTKQLFPGIAAQWNEALTIQLDEPGVALASQDGNLIVFAARTIYTVLGRAADNTGQSIGYEPPQRLSTEIGCVNPNSVRVSPVGVWFESHRGLCLLPRGGGEPLLMDQVEDTLAAFPIITDVTHNTRAGEVLFSVVDSEDIADDPEGRVLAFDYEHKLWFVRSYQNNPIACLCDDDGDTVFGIYDNAGAMTLWKEDDGFDDADGSYVGWTIETGDVRLGGVAGYHDNSFLTLLGEAFGACSVRVRESLDSGANWATAVTFTVAGAEAEFGRRYQTKVRKSGAHRYEIVELVNGTLDSRGVALSGARIEGKPFNRAVRLPAGKQG